MHSAENITHYCGGLRKLFVIPHYSHIEINRDVSEWLCNAFIQLSVTTLMMLQEFH